MVGKVAERAVALNDVTTDEAADYVQGRLRRLGVDRALARAGARDGDLVHIGDLSFTWYRDQPEFTGEPPPASRPDERRSPTRWPARTVVVKIGSSSVTTADGPGRRRAIDKLAAEVAEARADGPPGGGGHLGGHRRRLDHAGRGPAPTLGPGHPAGRGRRRPAPAHAGVERRPGQPRG